MISNTYFNQLSKVTRLSDDEVIDRITRYQAGDESQLQPIVESYLKLVVFLTQKYKNVIQKMDLFTTDDFIMEGNVGLIKAVSKFNPDVGIKFSSYAAIWINKGLIDFININKNQIRNPHHKCKKDKAIEKAIGELYQHLMQEITPEDIENLGVFTTDEIYHYFNKTTTIPFIGTMEFGNDDLEFEMTESDMPLRIKNAMKYLTNQERMFVKLHFGLVGGPLNSKEICVQMGITKGRGGQIKKIALDKLKVLLTNPKKGA